MERDILRDITPPGENQIDPVTRAFGLQYTVIIDKLQTLVRNYLARTRTQQIVSILEIVHLIEDLKSDWEGDAHGH